MLNAEVESGKTGPKLRKREGPAERENVFSFSDAKVKSCRDDTAIAADLAAAVHVRKR